MALLKKSPQADAQGAAILIEAPISFAPTLLYGRSISK
jgi:hypothetical protein